MNKKMNVFTEPRNSVRHFPGFEVLADERKPHWIYRFAVWSGVIMATTPTPENPKGWQFNPATATLAILIASLIAGGSYYIGGRDRDIRLLEEQIKEARKNAADAKQLETYNAGSVDAMKGHANSNTEKKK